MTKTSEARVGDNIRRADLQERTIEGFAGAGAGGCAGACADTFRAVWSAYDVTITEDSNRVVLKQIKHLYKPKINIASQLVSTDLVDVSAGIH